MWKKKKKRGRKEGTKFIRYKKLAKVVQKKREKKRVCLKTICSISKNSIAFSNGTFFLLKKRKKKEFFFERVKKEKQRSRTEKKKSKFFSQFFFFFFFFSTFFKSFFFFFLLAYLFSLFFFFIVVEIEATVWKSNEVRSSKNSC